MGTTCWNLVEKSYKFLLSVFQWIKERILSCVGQSSAEELEKIIGELHTCFKIVSFHDAEKDKESSPTDIVEALDRLSTQAKQKLYLYFAGHMPDLAPREIQSKFAELKNDQQQLMATLNGCIAQLRLSTLLS